jgi:hypothetical protein
MIGVRFPQGTGNFSLHHRLQTGCEAHAASYPMSTRGSLRGDEPDHSPPSSAEVRECVELYLHPNTSSWRGAYLSTGATLPFYLICSCFCITLAKGSTSKERPSPHFHKVPTRSNEVSPRTLQTALILYKLFNWISESSSG